MPQLDTLTYFSQYVYLFSAFVAVYYFVLKFIIPYIVCTFKIRQKLNSLNQENSSYEDTTDSLKLLEAFRKSNSEASSDSNIASEYSRLLYKSWLTKTSQITTVESMNQWLASILALQLAQNIRIKKILCDQIVRKITNSIVS